MKRIGLFTSSSFRHKYFISELSKRVRPDLVVIEKKSPISFFDKEEKYFLEKISSEVIDTNQFMTVEKGMINSEKVKKAIIEKEIDTIFVFGSSILKEEIFNSVDKCINIHTGLIQEYRGVDSNFWCIFENKPESIGVTIHKVNKGIDTGNILLQSRVPLRFNDKYEDIFLRSCEVGVDILSKNIEKVLHNKIVPKPLKSRGKLFMIKDMNDSARQKVNSSIQMVIKKYLDEKSSRDQIIKLINGVEENGLYNK